MSVSDHPCALPLGFMAAGISAQIKKSGKKDLALLYSQSPCTASAFFTTNRIQAAPLQISRRHLKDGRARAVVINSGNANCMTGQKGLKDALATAAYAAKVLGVETRDILVSSTGIIGRPLPLDKIKAALPSLAGELSGRGLSDAARAIMTTDTFPKEVVKKLKLGQKNITIAGIAKGAGMIAPDMKHATMLAYLLTDAAVSKPVLDQALSEAVEDSFNAITIDGCMSTNDTAMALANGAAGNAPLRPGSQEASLFSKALKEVCVALAQLIVRDAEGITKFIEINVRGAANDREAKALALSVAHSNLFKCAMFGSDPNWGRIAAAMGSVDSGLRWEKMEIRLNKAPVFRCGRPVPVMKKGLLAGKDIVVDIHLHRGTHHKTVYTSDLSYGYVRINAEYN